MYFSSTSNSPRSMSMSPLLPHLWVMTERLARQPVPARLATRWPGSGGPVSVVPELVHGGCFVRALVANCSLCLDFQSCEPVSWYRSAFISDWNTAFRNNLMSCGRYPPGKLQWMIKNFKNIPCSGFYVRVAGERM